MSENRTLSESWRETREGVLDRDDHSCRHCGVGEQVAHRLEVHHILPVEEGGGDNRSNLLTLCERCHKAIHRLHSGESYPIDVLENPEEYSTYTPSDEEEEILQVMKQGRTSSCPWGFATPAHLREKTGISKGNIEYHLRQLREAGWIERENRGLYRFREDPRDEAPVRDKIKAAARERWGEAFRIKEEHYTDGTSEVYAYHNRGRDKQDRRVRDRMGVYDGELGIVRQYIEPDRMVDSKVLEGPEDVCDVE